jgi:hypothetical protein
LHKGIFDEESFKLPAGEISLGDLRHSKLHWWTMLGKINKNILNIKLVIIEKTINLKLCLIIRISSCFFIERYLKPADNSFVKW